ncbi:MAG: hypothetical protein IKK79_06825 [Spirochaetaceae bacterium]|nr:hypothetical protein [Spirochaetaceae bacterium]
MTRNSLERRKGFWGRLTSLSVIAFVVALSLLSAACNNVNLAGKGSGTVSLAIDEVLASEIRSAIPAPLRSTTGDNSTYTLTASIRGDYSEEKTESATEASLSGVTFTFEGIPTGKNIILDVTVKVGDNTIWYGNSGKHMVVSGINNLNVAVGRVSGVLLWNNDSVKIAPYGNWDAVGTVPGEWNPPVYCYDNRGNVYRAGSNGASRFDLTKEGTYPSSPSSTGYSGTADLIAYDNVTGILYGITGGITDGITNAQIKKLTTSGSDPIIDLNVGITPEGFAVYNGFAYVADSSSSTTSTVSGEEAVVNFYKYNVENKNLSSSKTITLPEVFASTNNYDSVSQMIYQDGALYLLLSRVKDSAPNIFSVGAVAKIDAESLSLDTSFGQGGYLGLVSTKRQVSYKDSSGQDKSYSVYAAGNSTEDVFSNPLGFVAIMPKKLVIADAGCIIESDDTVDQGGMPKLKGKAVSRIVTVDLETQSLGFENLDPNQYYWNGNPLGSSVEISSSF